MGKKIDGFMLTLGTALILYHFFYRAFGDRRAAIPLALFCCAVLVKLMRRIFALFTHLPLLKRWRIRRHTGGALMRIACMDEHEALQSVEKLLALSYRNDAPVALVQAHPATSLSGEKIFDAWRSHRNEERLVICATCKCDPNSRMLAQSLKQPKLALVDADALSLLIAEHPEGLLPETDTKRPRLRLRYGLQILIDRKNAPRCLLLSLSMLTMYIFSGNIFYLIAALFLFTIALISLHRAGRPAKLF